MWQRHKYIILSANTLGILIETLAEDLKTNDRERKSWKNFFEVVVRQVFTVRASLCFLLDSDSFVCERQNIQIDFEVSQINRILWLKLDICGVGTAIFLCSFRRSNWKAYSLCREIPIATGQIWRAGGSLSLCLVL